MNYNCSNFLDVRNLQEQVKIAFCYQKLFWPFTVWINWPSDLKIFANSWPSASNFKSFSQSLEQIFLTVGQNNFGNKIPFIFHSVATAKLILPIDYHSNTMLNVCVKCSLVRRWLLVKISKKTETIYFIFSWKFTCGF